MARERLTLLDGAESQVHAALFDRGDGLTLTAGTMWLWCREAIDAGDTAAAEKAKAHLRDSAHVRAVLSAADGATTGDEDSWHAALAIALDQGLRLIAVDALEGLAIGAARSESWTEALRLLGAAGRVREETAYAWRFPFEQRAVDSARESAADALGAHAEVAFEEGRGLEWHEAGEYARRARGERGRPSHGWASLTPTEQQVVALVAVGFTNPEIAGRLLMGRATVKTHLEHVFVKLAVRSRAELAAQASLRGELTR